jgi:DNA modification methylase
MTQETFDIKEEDEFVKSLNLTEEKIITDLEEMKDIEGFPLGDIEDILELSEPPYYTAYPNPYIKDFIEYFGTPYDEETDDYNVEPFVGDVSEGKNDKIYVAHSYHTKVPPKAIEKYIKHYTKPGDIVLDGFAGSGMTGVAARSLGRNVILNDISSLASFLSSNFNKKHDLTKFIDDTDEILKKLHLEFDDIYATKHDDGTLGKIQYVVWADLYECPFCHTKHSYFDFTDELKSKNIICPNCHVEINKKADLIKCKHDNKAISLPVLINYSIGRKRYKKYPDEEDLELINYFNNVNIPNWVPIDKMLFKGKNWGDTWRAGYHSGIEQVNHFYLPRPLFVLSKIYDLSEYNLLRFVFTSIADRHAVIRNKFVVDKYGANGRIVGPLSGTLYVPDIKAEVNLLDIYKRKRNDIYKAFSEMNYSNSFIISTQASNDLKNIPKNSIDYIFVDPPFGANLMYSELNFILESWIKVRTNNTKEAIKNDKFNKSEGDYEILIIECFKEFYRVLKPNRWITIEFHNSNASIWKIIQNSIIKSGFIIAQVGVLDKKQSTLNQDLNVNSSVQNDLVINAYKPSKKFETKFLQKSGLNMELEFIEMHLDKLPIEKNSERTQQMLYSKLLAFYIQSGFEVPDYDASEFYNLLKRHFVERGGYWFTFNQIDKFDEKLKLNEKLGKYDVPQSILGIYDEKSAIIWLNQFLKEPKTYDDIFINFSKNLLTSFDNIPELRMLLEENFILEDNKYKSPSDLERTKIEKLRNKRLLKEFNTLLDSARSSKKKIKEVRKEALFAGLMNLYKEKDVETIKLLGERIDSKIIESDDDISAIINWAKYK